MAASTNTTISPSKDRTDTQLRPESVPSEAQDEVHRPATVASSTGSSHEAQSTSPRMENNNTTSDGDNADKLKRKRQPRNSACQSCAALKMKCIATSTPGICERCSRMNRECLPAIPKPRKRRATDAFEPKSMALSELLDHSPRQDRYRPVARPYLITEINGNDLHRNHLPPPVDHDDRGTSLIGLLAHGLALDQRTADRLLQGIDHETIRQHCVDFQFMASLFPFVSIPYADPMSLVTRRPVTTIAICVVASAARPQLRSRYNEAFRHVLATRAMIEGERSIDLMIGLFIYLSWNHQYFRKQQIYQYIFLLAGMAVDLGIQKKPSLAEQARGVPDAETQKAFLGIYYLTTTIPLVGFSKPAPLAWTPSLDHFASCIFSSNPGEVNLQPYVDLAHLLEDHASLLTSISPTQPAAIDVATTSTLTRLKALKRQYSSLSSTPAFAKVAIHVNACALLSQSTSTPPGSALIQTAVAVKEYIDDILLRPPSLLHQTAMVDWSTMLEAIIVIARLSSPAVSSSITRGMAPTSSGWEANALSTMLQPEAILDAVVAHMASAPNDDRHGPRHEESLIWLSGMCDKIKRHILQDRNGLTPGGESHFDLVSKLDSHRRNSHSGHSIGVDDARFRAVNVDASATSPHHLPPPSASSWSPRGVSDFGFDFFGGVGLLDESFWSAFGKPAGR